MENLLSIEERLKEKQIVAAEEELTNLIRSNPELIKDQIGLSKELETIDCPLEKMLLIKEKLSKLNFYLGEIEDALKNRWLCKSKYRTKKNIW